jgi:hypothetical protein
MIYQELFAMYKQTQMQMNEFWDWRFEKLNKF